MSRYFSSFILCPKVNEQPISLSINESIRLIISVILYYFGVVILTSLIFLPILKLLNLLPEHNLRLSEIPLSFKLIVFVPIFEEVIFRLPLKFTKQNLFLSLSGLQFLLFYHNFNLTILVGISFAIFIVPYLRLIPNTLYSKMEYLWQKYFPFLYYGLALSFGLLHLTNFVNLKLAHFLLFPLFVSNQIVMGLMIGYVRVTYKKGFIFSILIHFFINLPLILISRL
jgi:membrane protease YdiL (CAAX protease family)